jgi:hypothetical protein
LNKYLFSFERSGVADALMFISESDRGTDRSKFSWGERGGGRERGEEL